MKFAVTGGSGFIGSHIVNYLLSQNHQVTVVDNLWRKKSDNLSGHKDTVDFHNIDILDFDKLKLALKDVDGIFHQAGLTSVSESFVQKEKYHDVNVTGTENVFKLAKEFKIKVVYASSSSVYGSTTSVPTSENSEKNPISPYGITKLKAEKLAEYYHDLGASIIGLRYFNVYGPGQTDDYAGVITKFYDRITANNPPIIFGDGKQTRDFISIDDVVKANYLSMTGNAEFAFLNVGTGIATSVKELALLMIRLSGKELKLQYGELPEGDAKESRADASLAKKTINWSYETSLESGLQKFFF